MGLFIPGPRMKWQPPSGTCCNSTRASCLIRLPSMILHIYSQLPQQVTRSGCRWNRECREALRVTRQRQQDRTLLQEREQCHGFLMSLSHVFFNFFHVDSTVQWEKGSSEDRRLCPCSFPSQPHWDSVSSFIKCSDFWKEPSSLNYLTKHCSWSAKQHKKITKKNYFPIGHSSFVWHFLSVSWSGRKCKMDKNS